VSAAEPSETANEAPRVEAAPEELLDAVRALTDEVGGLHAELEALRSQSQSLPPSAERPGWGDRTPARLDSPAWVRSLDSPALRGPAVPRLLLEIVFLVAVAVVAAVARLDPPAIVAVMAIAWGLVALTEWLAARRARQREELAYAALRVGTVYAEDPSWFGPPLDRTALDVVDEVEDTGARLPPPQD
jgi:Flp pilus assembly protein TadB